MSVILRRAFASAGLLFLYLCWAPALQAGFVNLGPAGDFNLFVLNDHSQYWTDVGGRVAVGRDAKYSPGYTVGSAMGGTKLDTLIVGRDLTNADTTQNGGLLVGRNATWVNPTVNGNVAVNGNANFAGGGGTITGTVAVGGTYAAPNGFPSNTYTSPATFPFDFTEVGNYLKDQSTFLSTQPVNGITIIEFGQVHLTGTSPTYNSFYVTGAQMAGAAGKGLKINAPAGSTVVVNIDGSTSAMQSMGIDLSGGIDKQHILYNFYQASSVTLGSITVLGTILAPRADVHFGFGAIDGTIIANNLDGNGTGGGESHLFLFQGNLPSVPEPSTLVLAAMGLAALGWQVHKRKRK